MNDIHNTLVDLTDLELAEVTGGEDGGCGAGDCGDAAPASDGAGVQGFCEGLISSLGLGLSAAGGKGGVAGMVMGLAGGILGTAGVNAAAVAGCVAVVNGLFSDAGSAVGGGVADGGADGGYDGYGGNGTA